MQSKKREINQIRWTERVSTQKDALEVVPEHLDELEFLPPDIYLSAQIPSFLLYCEAFLFF